MRVRRRVHGSENAQWVVSPAIRLPVLQTSEDENAFGPQAWSVMFL